MKTTYIKPVEPVVRFGGQTLGADVAAWAQAGQNVDDKLRIMWEAVRAQGARALHQDDGWVQRDKGLLHLQYPFYRLPGIKAGDRIAVTDYQTCELIEVLATTDDPDKFIIPTAPQEHSGPDHLGEFTLALIGAVLFILLVVEWLSHRQ